MNLIPYNEPFLVSQFREFYTEVIRLKGLIKSGAWVAPAKPGVGTNGNSSPVETGTWVYYAEMDRAASGSVPDGATNTSLTLHRKSQLSVDDYSANQPPSSVQTRIGLLVWQSMLAMFRRHALPLQHFERIHARSYFEAQYIMAAFADEVFIHLDWEGGAAWTSNLLESTLFQSHVAGEAFFEKVDQLLSERDPACKGLAAVYLTALSLGFRGKYYGVNDHGRLRHYRRELFAFAFSEQANLKGESRIAFPDAYVQGLRKEERRKLTNPRVWVGVLGIVFLSYLIVSHVIWLNLTSRLERANSQIVETERRLNSIPITTR
jgi:type IV/VI secretion system ImpK/VasF family protein